MYLTYSDYHDPIHSRAFSEALYVIAKTPSYRHYSFEQIEARILYAIKENLYLVFRNEQDFPVGFVSYAYINDDILDKIKDDDHYHLHPKDYRSGNHSFILDMIYQYDHITQLRNLIHQLTEAGIFIGDKLHFKRIYAHGRTKYGFMPLRQIS
jgi:hemolysin-activating ACP:hemolysin acyltransferase